MKHILPFICLCLSTLCFGQSYPLRTIAEMTTNAADGSPAALGETCELRGVVYGVNLRPGGLLFTIIDENNDGIAIFSGNDNFGYTVQEGDGISVRGEVGFFNGLTELFVQQPIEVLSTDNTLVDPTVVTQLDESTESQLVRIENVSLVDPSQWDQGETFNADLTDGTNTFQIRVDGNTGINIPAPEGAFTLIGLGNQFDRDAPHDSGYQIFPRYAADFVTEVTAVEFPSYPIGQVTTNNMDGEPDSLNVNCTLRGIVYGVNLNNGLQFTIIDENNDGISVFNGGDNLGYTVLEGDEIEVQGQIGFFNGLTQISAEAVRLVSSGNSLFDPTVVTALGEMTESQLVRVENVSVVDPSQWQSGGSFNVDLTDGSNTFTMRIDSDTGIDLPAPEGMFDLIGLGGQFDREAPYDEGYQILPRYAEDIIAEAVEVQFPLYAIGQVTTNDGDGEPDSLNVNCTLRGVVYGVNLNSGLQFTIIDQNNDGISVFNGGDNLGYTVMEGDEIEVKGQIGFFNGLTQINATEVNLLSSSNTLFDPTIVATLDETTESQLVKLENVSLVDPSQWQDSGSFNVDVTDGSNTFTMRIDSDTEIVIAAPEGIFSITGLGGQFDREAPYDEGYQILPRYESDIETMPLSTKQLDLSNRFGVQPNPTDAFLYLKTDLKVAYMTISNQIGQQVAEFAALPTLIDVQNWQDGFYFITAYTEQGVGSLKFLKQ